MPQGQAFEVLFGRGERADLKARGRVRPKQPAPTRSASESSCHPAEARPRKPSTRAPGEGGPRGTGDLGGRATYKGAPRSELREPGVWGLGCGQLQRGRRACFLR